MTPEQLTGQTDHHLQPTLMGQKLFLIHPDVVNDILALKKAASQAGFDLHIASGFRSFQHQLKIWNSKFSGESPVLDKNSQPLITTQLSETEKVMSILKWSALPGASRHHWGSDFDIYDRISQPSDIPLKLEPDEYLAGFQRDFFQWLQVNMQQYGFFLPYDQDRGGVAAEPWHISHHSVSSRMKKELTPEIILETLNETPIYGKKVIKKELNTIYNQFIININQV
ncbi:D-alanyl-D-alanine carboxypeptidase [Vibrio aerogenes CECT 7868]|uniref:D-alanyl-D-alanine carboxypeptidase n=1 Tax=Vibrio aerogenes CECT 7868 TaxID=1216006 RepID=A0A1M5W8H1_9VIBR|nr:M15 family metallopeptidase [Vibrio aerogenes]SHH83777.1 D-alanyl-D-alanine carboxypeptidase [Vibrio aerogenes CECT 7868]